MAIPQSKQVRVQFVNDGKCQQHFREECDINTIMDRYRRTGVLGDPTRIGAIPQFRDYSELLDFATAQNILVHAREAFDELPAAIRRKFGHDPAQMMDYLANPENDKEAISLGLKEERKKRPISIEDLKIDIGDVAAKLDKTLVNQGIDSGEDIDPLNDLVG